MPFLHDWLCPLHDPSKPSVGLLRSYSPPFILTSECRPILLQALHPMLFLPSRIAHTLNQSPKHHSLWQALLPHTCHIPRTISYVSALSPLCSRRLIGQARRRTRGCGRRASVSASRDVGGAWSGEPVVAYRGQACSGSTPRTRRVVSRSAGSSASSTVRPDDHRFPSCTAGSTPRPSEDAVYRH